jgi:hypothetical protein
LSLGKKGTLNTEVLKPRLKSMELLNAPTWQLTHVFLFVWLRSNYLISFNRFW